MARLAEQSLKVAEEVMARYDWINPELKKVNYIPGKRNRALTTTITNVVDVVTVATGTHPEDTFKSAKLVSSLELLSEEIQGTLGSVALIGAKESRGSRDIMRRLFSLRPVENPFTFRVSTPEKSDNNSSYWDTVLRVDVWTPIHDQYLQDNDVRGYKLSYPIYRTQRAGPELRTEIVQDPQNFEIITDVREIQRFGRATYPHSFPALMEQFEQKFQSEIPAAV